MLVANTVSVKRVHNSGPPHIRTGVLTFVLIPFATVTVRCFQVVDCRNLPGSGALAQMRSLTPRNDVLLDLIRMAAPSCEEIPRPHTYPRHGRTIGELAGTSSTAYYRVAPAEVRMALALLESHRAPVVTALDTGCEISVCLGFHQDVQNDLPSNEWARTEVGELVRKAKYDRNEAAVSECCRRVVGYVARHPVLCRLTGVAAMPGSSRLPARMARAIQDEFDVPLVGLQRIKQVKQAKNMELSDNPDANQRDSMLATPPSDPSLIVVVDDLMGQGSTVREASRALRAAGALQVCSVMLSKNIKGTREYPFD